MIHSVDHLLWGLILAAASTAVMFVARNRVIRRRLRWTVGALAAYLLVHGIAWYLASADPAAVSRFPQASTIENLLLAFAVVSAGVALVFNPWFSDRMREHAPAIVQDALLVGMFATVAVFGLGERAWITSTAVAALIGFALQEQLANAFAGLAIQIDRPFKVGHWIRLGEFDGQVVEVTWRATKIRTKAGNLVILPNNIVARDAISNFSEPAAPTRLHVEVGAAYGVPPNQVRAALLSALSQVEHVLPEPPPEVLLQDFGDSAILYRLRFWTVRFDMDEPIKQAVRTAIYYELHRQGIEIPWPIRVLYNRADAAHDSPEIRESYEASIRVVPVLSPLDTDAHRALAASARPRLFADGEVVVREGDGGSSMFVVRRGQVAVTIGPDRREVAVTRAGGYFGEMSLLTGEARTATVVARGDCELLEIDAEAFGAFVRNRPEVIDAIAASADERRRALDASRGVNEARTEVRASLAQRMRQFLGL